MKNIVGRTAISTNSSSVINLKGFIAFSYSIPLSSYSAHVLIYQLLCGMEDKALLSYVLHGFLNSWYGVLVMYHYYRKIHICFHLAFSLHF